MNRVDRLMMNKLSYDSYNNGTGNNIKWLRWVAVIPSSIFAWYTMVAVYFLSQTSAIGEFMSTIFAGLLGVFSVAKLLGSPVLPNKALQPTCRITARS